MRIKRRVARWSGTAIVLLGVLAGGRAHAVPPTERCDQEVYAWVGAASVAGSDQVDTGVIVSPQIGSTLRVVGISADGIDSAGYATAMPVSVGDATAAPGAMVPGGPIRIHGVGPSLTVRGATVVVERCSLVAVAAIPELPAGTLPETGGAETGALAASAALFVALGAGLTLVARRATAAGRAPGSRPAAAPPAQG